MRLVRCKREWIYIGSGVSDLHLHRYYRWREKVWELQHIKRVNRRGRLKGQELVLKEIYVGVKGRSLYNRSLAIHIQSYVRIRTYKPVAIGWGVLVIALALWCL